jgi:hypothetical protein
MEIRTCGCGCGTPLRTPFSEFAPGHHMRVARRGGPRGSALPVRAPQVAPCLHCGRDMAFSDRPGKFCSLECMAAYRLALKPWNGLQLRCFRYMTAHGLGVAPFCRAAGVKPNTFRAWVTHKGRAPARATLRALAGLLGITEAQALAEAEGVTAEDRRQENTRRLVALESWRSANTPEARAKKSATQTGRKRPPEVVEKLRAAARAPERLARSRERMREWHMSIAGQALARLGQLLKREPAPDRELRREWEERVGRELAVKPHIIRAHWRDTFRRRGLVRGDSGGPRLLENRHRIVEEFMAGQGVRPHQQMPRGFWPAAALRLQERDPRDELDGPALGRWYLAHLKVCRRTYVAPRGASQK